MVSAVFDYTFNKHFDVYAGLAYSELGGGISNGYLNTNNTFFMSGLRLKF
jgi:predicted porin